MTASLITVQNCPRDKGAILATSRAIRYRLALTLGIFKFEDGSPDPELEKAFTTAADDFQAEALLSALMAADQAAGVPAHGSQPPPPQAAAVRQPATVTAAPGVLKPTVMKTEPTLARQPSTAGDPANKGATNKAAAAVAGPAGESQMLAVIGKVWDTMQGVGKNVDTLTSLNNEHAESFVQIVGQLANVSAKLVDLKAELDSSKKVQGLLLGLIVEMAGAQLGLDRGSMVKIAAVAAQEALELTPGDAAGK